MLSARLDRLAHDLLAPDGIKVDFKQPHGEPALLSPESVSWRVFANPVTLFIGGVAAVILELAEPRVRAGVWNHTTFRTDPVQRLRRTGLAAMVTVYGARSVAEAMIGGVNRLHAGVEGITDEGLPYRAADPELLTWVQATAAYGFLEAYATYVRPVSTADRDAYYAEGRGAAELYGATAAPTSQRQLDDLFAAMLPKLGPSPIIAEFLAIMRSAPLLPTTLRPLQRLLVRAAVAIVPVNARRLLGVDARVAWFHRHAVRGIAKAADRIVLPSAPSAQACVRAGLSPTYLRRQS